MKCYVKIILLWVALVLPISLFSSEPVASVAERSTTLNDVMFEWRVSMPDRDDADDDVVYEYGFEDGWNEWTHADLSDVPAMWHVSEEHAYEDGSSWWCADEDLNGYDNHWLQYLVTPVLDLRNHEELTLEFMLYYSCEDPELGAPHDTTGYDGWDGCNVWISTDGGDEWEVLTPVSPEYGYESLYSFGEEWGMGFDIPGWAGFNDEWFEAEFDLSDYAEEQVQIRWAFCSDPAWATGDNNDEDREAIGMLVDEMRILAGDQPLWENDGSEVGEMETETMAEVAGDFWEISDDDAHTGDYSAHCPIEENLNDALISPPIEIPEEGWYTYFEFWLLCNTVACNPDGDRSLNDLFRIYLSNNDGVSWQYVLHDYGHPDQRPNWYEDWALYGPDSWYGTEDASEWQIKLNMTRFAGETIMLRWHLVTDDIMEGDQGSGLWIDDFTMLTTSRRENDVGLEWMHVGYPITQGQTTDCQIMLGNYGMASQNSIRKYYQIDEERARPIIPWQGEIGPDEIETYNFRPQWPYAGEATLSAYTDLPDDENPNNNLISTEVIILPEDMHQLGYDDRRSDVNLFSAVNTGPAVLFTPDDDGVGENVRLHAVEVQWSEGQDGEAPVTLRVFDDRRGDIGDELYSEEIMIGPDDLHPNIHRINLTDVEALQNIDDDFWVYFNIEGNDSLPRFMGRRIGDDDPNWGEGHFFVSNGVAANPSEFEFLISALVTPAGELPDVELTAGRSEVDFEAVDTNTEKAIGLTVFGGGTSPVTIEGVSIDNEVFTATIEEELPVELGIGEHLYIMLTYLPQEEGEFSGTLSFDCDDDSPPTVDLIGTSLGVEAGDVDFPVSFSLGDAYPNPFNATAVIPFDLLHSTDVKLALYDLNGRKVVDLVTGNLTVGRHEFTLNANNLAAGVYLYRLQAGSFTAVKKLALVK
ncbi:MAG: T9SS type A sorting domain-containing protein [Candidatus Hatepunaea meridiana]|nr:T9SS type A sorting domain-containing protein [Candidatus Hatepunaea meridiana]